MLAHRERDEWGKPVGGVVTRAGTRVETPFVGKIKTQHKDKYVAVVDERKGRFILFFTVRSTMAMMSQCWMPCDGGRQ